jgi:hypothetical protein
LFQLNYLSRNPATLFSEFNLSPQFPEKNFTTSEEIFKAQRLIKNPHM